MTFWAYMIQCADRHLYAGHTDDLARRIGEHQIGSVPGCTRTRRPVHLVWSQEFPTRYEALRAERQIKGWSRLKKLALIRGDWAAISALARSPQEQGRASTSSARTERGVRFGPNHLMPHPSSLPSDPLSLEITGVMTGSVLRLRFTSTGSVDRLLVPDVIEPTRRDELWRHTCFELFLRPSTGEEYCEFNFAPSTAWAAYRFDRYRSGMENLPMKAPRIRVGRTPRRLELQASFDLPTHFTPASLGLSAVIEEASGRKSYWALAHPPGDAPDFHHPDCFALELPPATDT